MAGTKARAACSLRIAGSSYQEIADVLNYTSIAQVRNDVNRVLAETSSDDDKLDHRRVANARLETMLGSIWDQATDKESPEVLTYQRQAGAIVKEIISLNGAAAPQELVVHTPTTAQIMEWVARVGASTNPEVEEADVFAIEGSVEREDSSSDRNSETIDTVEVPLPHEDQA